MLRLNPERPSSAWAARSRPPRPRPTMSAGRSPRLWEPPRSELASASRAARQRWSRDMSELLALGISHKTAPVALRERLAFTEQEARDFAIQATATEEVREAVVISTC